MNGAPSKSPTRVCQCESHHRALGHPAKWRDGRPSGLSCFDPLETAMGLAAEKARRRRGAAGHSNRHNSDSSLQQRSKHETERGGIDSNLSQIGDRSVIYVISQSLRKWRNMNSCDCCISGPSAKPVPPPKSILSRHFESFKGDTYLEEWVFNTPEVLLRSLACPLWIALLLFTCKETWAHCQTTCSAMSGIHL